MYEMYLVPIPHSPFKGSNSKKGELQRYWQLSKSVDAFP